MKKRIIKYAVSALVILSVLLAMVVPVSATDTSTDDFANATNLQLYSLFNRANNCASRFMVNDKIVGITNSIDLTSDVTTNMYEQQGTYRIISMPIFKNGNEYIIGRIVADKNSAYQYSATTSAMSNSRLELWYATGSIFGNYGNLSVNKSIKQYYNTSTKSVTENIGDFYGFAVLIADISETSIQTVCDDVVNNLNIKLGQIDDINASNTTATAEFITCPEMNDKPTLWW